MTNQELNVLFTSTTDQTRPLLNSLLQKYEGTLVSAIGRACLCVFENSTKALETAREMKQQSATARAALTRGMVTLSPTSATGEAANLAAQLEGMARPGEILATENFVRSVRSAAFQEMEVRQFKGISGAVKIFSFGSAKKPAEGDGKEYFDFARVEQERALEARMAPRPDFKAMDDDASIPFAVDPVVATGSRAQVNVPSARTLQKEHRSKTMKNVLITAFVFIVVLPAVFFGFWWLIGTAQKTMVQSDEEIQKRIDSSDVLQAIHTKRPPGARPVDIARGTFQAYATLVIETSPSKAEVFVEERRIEALTPVKINSVEARTPIHVVIKKPGYKSFVQLLSLLPNEQKKLTISLEKSP